MALTPGTKLGPYEIVAPLGAGGMGEVYRARDTRLGRDVAIKVLPAHLAANLDLKQRLEREAKAISALNHPHICTLHDVGSQDGVDFLVMEHVEGETLSERLHRGKLELDEALQLAIQIADALDKAHVRGIVHRDLKPGNVMLTKHGTKLMDFGLAKPAPGLSTAAAVPLTPTTPTISVAALTGPSSPLTQKGTVVGTFQYMAPEVLQGAEADARSDIFSFGCVLYEMITGRRAFEGKSQFSVLGAVLDHEPEHVSAFRPTSPPRLDETVRRCLAKNPDQRYGCMHDVRIQLEALAESAPAAEAQPETAKAAASSPRLAWLIAGLAALIALSVCAAYFLHAPNLPSVVQSSILPPQGTAFITMLPSSGPPAFSPDGARLAFSARDDKGKVLLYVRPLTSLTAKALTGTDDAIYPFWSADSRELGFFADGKLKKISADGGPPQTLCDAASGRGGAWNKDGVIVFAPATTQPLSSISAAGGTPAPASKFNPSQEENSHRWPSFLPDGKHFLFWARSARGAPESVVYLGELGSLQARVVMKNDSTAAYASGHLLFLRDQTLMAEPFNTSRMELSGDAVPIAEHVGMNGATARPLFSASQTGALVYQAGLTEGGWNLVWWSRDGKQLGSAVQANRYVAPALSPDGSHLAVMIFSGAQGIGDIWVFDLARGTNTRLTFGPGSKNSPAWTPDGKMVSYSSTVKGPPHIYARAADGSGAEKTIVETPDVIELPDSFSHDGRYLVYSRHVPKSEPTNHLWVLPLFGDGKPFPIVQTTFDERFAAISSDGKWIAYQNNESGAYEIYVTPFPGGGAKWQVSTNGGISPKWRKDGKELYFIDGLDNIVAVDVNASANAVHLGVPHALFQAVGIQREYGPYDVTADGKKFLINSGNVNASSDPLTLVLNWPSQLKK
jgi:serine/threonine protein kinase